MGRRQPKVLTRQPGRRVRSRGVRLAEAKATVDKLEARAEIDSLRAKLRLMVGGRRKRS